MGNYDLVSILIVVMVRYVVAYEVCEGASIEPDVPKGRRIDVLLCITGGVIMV